MRLEGEVRGRPVLSSFEEGYGGRLTCNKYGIPRSCYAGPGQPLEIVAPYDCILENFADQQPQDPYLSAYHTEHGQGQGLAGAGNGSSGELIRRYMRDLLPAAYSFVIGLSPPLVVGKSLSKEICCTDTRAIPRSSLKTGHRISCLEKSWMGLG